MSFEKKNDVAWRGFLLYKHKTTFTFTQYHQFIAVLRRESSTGPKRLELFEMRDHTPHSSPPHTIIPLTDVLHVTDREARAHRFAFQVLATSNKHHFATRTLGERDQWVKELNSLLFGPPLVGVIYEYQVQILPNSHADQLNLNGKYVLKISDTELALYSTSGTLPTRFHCRLTEILRTRYSTFSSGGGVLTMLVIYTRNVSEVGEGMYVFQAQSASDISRVIDHRVKEIYRLENRTPSHLKDNAPPSKTLNLVLPTTVSSPDSVSKSATLPHSPTTPSKTIKQVKRAKTSSGATHNQIQLHGDSDTLIDITTASPAQPNGSPAVQDGSKQQVRSPPFQSPLTTGGGSSDIGAPHTYLLSDTVQESTVTHPSRLPTHTPGNIVSSSGHVKTRTASPDSPQAAVHSAKVGVPEDRFTREDSPGSVSVESQESDYENVGPVRKMLRAGLSADSGIDAVTQRWKGRKSSLDTVLSPRQASPELTVSKPKAPVPLPRKKQVQAERPRAAPRKRVRKSESELQNKACRSHDLPDGFHGDHATPTLPAYTNLAVLEEPPVQDHVTKAEGHVTPPDKLIGGTEKKRPSYVNFTVLKEPPAQENHMTSSGNPIGGEGEVPVRQGYMNLSILEEVVNSSPANGSISKSVSETPVEEKGASGHFENVQSWLAGKNAGLGESSSQSSSVPSRPTLVRHGSNFEDLHSYLTILPSDSPSSPPTNNGIQLQAWRDTREHPESTISPIPSPLLLTRENTASPLWGSIRSPNVTSPAASETFQSVAPSPHKGRGLPVNTQFLHQLSWDGESIISSSLPERYRAPPTAPPTLTHRKVAQTSSYGTDGNYMTSSSNLIGGEGEPPCTPGYMNLSILEEVVNSSPANGSISKSVSETPVEEKGASGHFENVQSWLAGKNAGLGESSSQSSSVPSRPTLVRHGSNFEDLHSYLTILPSDSPSSPPTNEGNQLRASHDTREHPESTASLRSPIPSPLLLTRENTASPLWVRSPDVCGIGSPDVTSPAAYGSHPHGRLVSQSSQDSYGYSNPRGRLVSQSSQDSYGYSNPNRRRSSQDLCANPHRRRSSQDSYGYSNPRGQLVSQISRDSYGYSKPDLQRKQTVSFENDFPSDDVNGYFHSRKISEDSSGYAKPDLQRKRTSSFESDFPSGWLFSQDRDSCSKADDYGDQCGYESISSLPVHPARRSRSLNSLHHYSLSDTEDFTASISERPPAPLPEGAPIMRSLPTGKTRHTNRSLRRVKSYSLERISQGSDMYEDPEPFYSYVDSHNLWEVLALARARSAMGTYIDVNNRPLRTDSSSQTLTQNRGYDHLSPRKDTNNSFQTLTQNRGYDHLSPKHNTNEHRSWIFETVATETSDPSDLRRPDQSVSRTAKKKSTPPLPTHPVHIPSPSPSPTCSPTVIFETPC